MTFLQVITYLGILATVLLLIKAFWKELAIIWFLAYVFSRVIAAAFASTIIWAVFVTKSSAGWGWTFLFFTLAYTMFLVIYAMIVYELFTIVGNAIVSFFRRIIK